MTARTKSASALQVSLALEVGEMGLPDSVTGHPRLWGLVMDSEVDFLTALVWWEATGSEASGERLATAYRSVLRAWGTAGEVVR